MYFDTFLHRKRISPRKLFLGQGKVFPRAVFNPPRVGFAASSEARAVIETQGGLKTARGYTFVWARNNFQGEDPFLMQDGTFFQFSRNFYRKWMFQMASEAKKRPKKH